MSLFDYWALKKKSFSPNILFSALSRDGVGDGQIQYVLEHEIKAIQSCMAKAGLPDDQVKLTYIIVNKKINTKFISSPTPANPLCGTVIDDVVTLPER